MRGDNPQIAAHEAEIVNAMNREKNRRAIKCLMRLKYYGDNKDRLPELNALYNDEVSAVCHMTFNGENNDEAIAA